MRHNELTKINGTDLSVTKFSLGTAPIGGLFKAVGEEEAREVLDHALDAGINYVDTAPLYGYGVCEGRVGRATAGRNVIISTKLGRLLRPGKNLEMDKYPNADPNTEIYYDYSAAGIEKSIKDSLWRLGRDQIEIAYIHDADELVDQAINVVYPILARLREEGIIKAIGIGMNWLPASIAIMKETELNIALIAGRYTILDQSAQEELYPLALRKKVSIVAAGVFNTGVLANPVPGAHFDYAPAPQEIIDKAIAIRNFLSDYNVPLTAAALQFPLRHPAVATVLSGPGNLKELKANIADFDLELPANLWSDLEASGLITPPKV